ncbi:22424_t:CDS:1, partial [Gigaspora rosea]
VLVINYQPPLVQTQRQAGENLTINRDIFEIIDSGLFGKT